MNSAPRHQCLIYEGSPSKHLAAIAAVIQQRLNLRYRCLCLNSPPMIAGMRSYLAATGVDVLQEVARGSLIFSSAQSHLRDGKFDIDYMMETLRSSLEKARSDGYAGLWATGDMSWEFGPEKDFSRLLEYECRLEEFIRENPDMGGICQYHSGTLPRMYLRQALLTHRELFHNETLSHINPHYLSSCAITQEAIDNPDLELALKRLLSEQTA
ncbi:MAG TPA: MEDS domain-containing protein [Terracidiphilus sp.]|nr:MEDS domain-containing protein [Terracidiphilus sp.]